MEYADNDGVRVAYERAGTRDGETVVLVEGLGYGRWMWNWQREGLEEYDLLLPDNRGTGDSDVPDGPYTVSEMAADIDAVLTAAGVDRRLASDAPEDAREWQAAGVEAFDVSGRLAEVTVPALVLHGERDRVVPIENGRLLAEGLPEATLETVAEGGSHLFFIERPGDVTARLRAFLP